MEELNGLLKLLDKLRKDVGLVANEIRRLEKAGSVMEEHHRTMADRLEGRIEALEHRLTMVEKNGGYADWEEFKGITRRISAIVKWHRTQLSNFGEKPEKVTKKKAAKLITLDDLGF